MNMNKILAVLIIGIALVGLTGAASASMFDDIMADFGGYSPNFGSYAHTSIDYSYISNGVTSSVSEDYYGTHTCDFSESGITTHTDVTVYQGPSVYESYTPSYTLRPSVFDLYTPSYTPGPSVYESYVSTYSFWP